MESLQRFVKESTTIWDAFHINHMWHTAMGGSDDVCVALDDVHTLVALES